MIHARPQIKIHPAQSVSIPAFPRSHSLGAAAITHRPTASPPDPILTTVFAHDQIAERAYDIYVKNGRQKGQCQQNWEQAENDVRHQGLLACHSEHVMKDVFAPDAIDAG
jgi:hypothetical protein